VRHRNGRIDVTGWTSGPEPASNIIYARQNLPLIVLGAKPNPNLSDGPEWGATLGNAVRVWRSGVGIDRRGNLIHAAAPAQTVGSLAAILIHAGAVRAMELDRQHLLDELHHLPSPGGERPGEPALQHGPLLAAVSDPG
jgi:hypothetical protein